MLQLLQRLRGSMLLLLSFTVGANLCGNLSPVSAFSVIAAPIYVDIEYTRGREIVTRKGPGQAVRIGRMPLMLRCDRWG